MENKNQTQIQRERDELFTLIKKEIQIATISLIITSVIFVAELTLMVFGFIDFSVLNILILVGIGFSVYKTKNIRTFKLFTQLFFEVMYEMGDNNEL